MPRAKTKKPMGFDIYDRYQIPKCVVLVKKLSFGDISRMTISPFFVTNRCGRCRNFTNYGPKCTTCSQSYHYECALLRQMCCELPILINSRKCLAPACPKCQKTVDFGPHCAKCFKKFHGHCLTPYDQCCDVSICGLPPQKKCRKCSLSILSGPQCPLCKSSYHVDCLTTQFECCKIDFSVEKYKCATCARPLGLGSPMCLFCGKAFHKSCKRKRCCGKPIRLEVFFIASFKYVTNYFLNFSRKARPKRLDVTGNRSLRSAVSKDAKAIRRVSKKSAGCQTYVLDAITIENIKTEVEVIEEDVNSPPVLEREPSCSSPDMLPSSSAICSRKPSTDSEDSLRNLFDFLYNAVRKFPPQLQTQVKLDLFKAVTEAELKLQCNSANTSLQNGR